MGQRMAYQFAAFNKYGLWRDDLLYEDKFVKEALRRIPECLVDQRNYRILRATQCSIGKTVLPQSQWTKLEDDILYLTPYVDDVIREHQEKKAWESCH